MKKRHLIISAMLLAAAISTGSMAVYAETEEETVNIEEGYEETGDGWTSIVTWTANEDQNIYGEFYYPADFDETKTYPVVIMSHGFCSSHEQQFEIADWPQLLAQNGYVSYIYDFCGGAPYSYSDGNFEDMSVVTEIRDLNCVIDFVKGQSFTDTENLFLMGSSQGGLVSALTAPDRNDDIKGMILMYPAFCIPDNMRAQYPDRDEIQDGDTVQALGMDMKSQYVTDVYDMNVMEDIAGFDGDVLIVHGIGDVLVPYTDSVLAVEGPYAESSSELYLINGENTEHGFDTFHDDTKVKAHDVVLDYLDRQTAE